jgi:uncharacterized delta-60 repeat protein
MAIQPDGRVLVAGRHTSAAGDTDFLVARHLPDGGLDPTFGDGGAVVTKVTPNDDYINGMALDLSGRILVTGSTEVAAGEEVAVVRYTTEGEPDPNFSNDGIVTVDVVPADDGEGSHSVVPLSGGKILVVGGVLKAPSDGSDTFLVRLTSTGVPDPDFHTDGSHVFDLGQSFSSSSAVLAPAAKLIVAGSFGPAGDKVAALVRLNGAQAVDSTFSGDGIAAVSSGPTTQLFNALTIADGGSVLAAGFAGDQAGDDEDVVVRRFEPDGDPDPSFGDGGLVRTPVGATGVNDRAESVVTQPDGRVVVAGWTYGGPGPVDDRMAFVAR